MKEPADEAVLVYVNRLGPAIGLTALMAEHGSQVEQAQLSRRTAPNESE